MGILNSPTPGTDASQALKDIRGEKIEVDVNIASQVCGLIMDRWEFFKTSRLPEEEAWMRYWRNFRGIYGPTIRYTETEKSQVFVKITKTKTMAAIGQIMEVLMSNGDFPLTIEQTKKPEGIHDIVSVGPPGQDGAEQGSEDTPQGPSYGYHGDGKELPPGATHASLLGQGDEAQDIQKAGLKVTPGHTTDQYSVELDPAEMAAKAMERIIKDQIDECDGELQLRDAVYEMAILGTGCLGGPFTITKTYNQWVKDLEGTTALTYVPIEKDVPFMEAVSIWDTYPDPEARVIQEAKDFIRHRRATASQMRELRDRPGFRPNVIDYILENYRPDYQPRWFENELKDFVLRPTTQRYQVLEYWGPIDKEIAEQFGMEIPKEYFSKKEVFINAWICCNQVIRFILNPFLPVRIPYMLAPYERNPYKIWGMGVPENMEDSQMIMNGHARMAIDNLALAGNVVFEVDETYMTNTEDMRVYPGRVFRRQGGPPGQSIFAVKFPATTQENMMMFDKFRMLADEATNIPSISHGQTGITGTTRTSSGMSMIMNASTVSIKTVVKNIDQFLIKPAGEGFFAWNMQFNPDVDIRGDLEVRARGTASMMQKEVRSQRLMMFMQVGTNPALAPFIKWYNVLKELAKDLEIDPEAFVNNIDEAKLQALLQRAAGNIINAPTGAEQAENMAPPSGGVGGVSPQDTQGSGNGTIGTGTPQQTGEPGSTANGVQ